MGTRQALYDNQRDSITITISRVEPRSVGALIALYERAVGLYASLVNINAYHQPGVEAGKKAAAAILDLQRRVVRVLQAADRPLPLEDLARQADAGEAVETVYQIVRHLAANPRGIVLEGDPAKPNTLTASLRQLVHQS
jgi:glucose-6-phosphate isomerase